MKITNFFSILHMPLVWFMYNAEIYCTSQRQGYGMGVE